MDVWVSGPAEYGMTSGPAMYAVGEVYYDHYYGVVFTVTAVRYHADMELWAVARADLDYPCYGQNERIMTCDQIRFGHERLQ